LVFLTNEGQIYFGEGRHLMKKLLTIVVLLGMLLSLQAAFVSAQEPADTPEVTTYVVQEGDTAESIAETFGISVEELLAANSLDNANKIKQMVGEELVIPPTAQPTDEVTEEPVTEEPTQEATEQPTEEATEQPTEEATEQPTEEATPEPTEEPTEEATPEPTEEATPEPTEEPTEEATPEPTEEATPEPTEEATKESPAGRDESSEGVSTSDDAETAAAVPGTFTTEIVAIANLLETGVAEAPAMTLYNIDNAGEPAVTIDTVYPGGVRFVRAGSFPTGRFAGVIESSFPAAAVALTVNNSAKTADAYTGFNTPAKTLYGTLIFNKHANFESTLYCQNAGAGTATIQAALYKTGQSSPRITLNASVPKNETKVWDIADNAAVQAAWPGGKDQYGYVVFSSANDIACVVDNQRMASPYVQSQFNAVPTSYAGTDLRVPLVFHGHGSSSDNQKGLKWNTGISLVNIGSGTANVTVTYTSGSYNHTCTKSIPASRSDVWYAPEVGTGPDGWNCPKGPMTWSYPGGPTFGSIKVTSNVDILVIGNSNRYDSSQSLGAGYSSLGAAPSGLTNRAVCPLAFNKNPSSNWISGIQAANVGSVTTNIRFKMVRADSNPAASGKSVTITKSSIAPGKSATAYFPEEGSALTNFEGAVFVEATNSAAVIAVSSSNTNYNTLGSAALYDCINY
jgi:LysM repeat protein